MLEFRENCILTGIEKRISSKSGEVYIIANILGENGKTFSCVVECEIPQGLSQLDKVDVEFKVIPGRYTQLKVIGLKKVV
jgi:hypothetical protein